MAPPYQQTLWKHRTKTTLTEHNEQNEVLEFAKPTVKNGGRSLMFMRCFAVNDPGAPLKLNGTIQQSTRKSLQKIWLPLRGS